MDLEVPFFLRPVFLSVISIAPRHRRLHRLMREMMRRLDPAIAAIPTETGGPAEPPDSATCIASPRTHGGGQGASRSGPVGVYRGSARQLAGRTRRSAKPPRALWSTSLRRTGRLDPRTMRSASLYDAVRFGELFDRAVEHPPAVDWQAVGRIVTVELVLEAADAGLD